MHAIVYIDNQFISHNPCMAMQSHRIKLRGLYSCVMDWNLMHLFETIGFCSYLKDISVTMNPLATWNF